LEKKLKKKEYLTNERLKNKFCSFFDLCNYAIKIAKQRIIREEKVTLTEVIDDLINLPDHPKEKKI
jgi:hypothetical protein